MIVIRNLTEWVFWFKIDDSRFVWKGDHINAEKQSIDELACKFYYQNATKKHPHFS
jgi:hypothetical protein